MKMSRFLAYALLALLLAAPKHGAADGKSDLAAATKALAAKDYETVLGILARLEKAQDVTADERERAMLTRAMVYMGQGDSAAAGTVLREATQVFPQSARAEHALAGLLHRQAIYDLAAAAYERAIGKTSMDTASEIMLKLDYGWFLATCPEGRFRDGHRAVAYAEDSLKKLTTEKAAPLPSTLQSLHIFEVAAAGHAEIGAFDTAVAASNLAANFRSSLKRIFPEGEFAKKDFDKRAAGYKAGKPWREPSQ